MADLVYRTVMRDLKEKIIQGDFPEMRLPDERSLSASYHVSRSSVKRALSMLAQQGIIFKKRGSGTFINPLYLKNQSLFHYEGNNLGITDSLRLSNEKQGIKLLDYQVVPATPEIRQDLFLNDNDFVYQIKRLRLIGDKAFMIENGFIPIKITPTLSPDIVKGSIFNYLQEHEGKTVSKSFMTITVSPSTANDQQLLKLAPTEPVGIVSGVFFLDDGTPFELSNMRIHYKYMKYNTFVSLDNGQ